MSWDWVHQPNWASTVEHNFSYKTNIFRSGSGAETRVSCREKPRAEFKEAISIWGPKLRSLRSKMASSHGEPVFKIDFSDKREIAAPQGLEVSFGFSENPLWLFSTARVGIFTSGGWNHATVTSFFDGVVTLDAPLVFGGKSYVAPVRVCFAAEETTISMLTSTVADFSVVFEEDPTTFVLPTGAEDRNVEVVYHNQSVFPFVPNFRDSWDETYARPTKKFDAGWGRVARALTYDAPDLAVEFTALARTRAAGMDMINFFHRRKGRWRSFYLPSYTEDFTFSTPAAAGDREVWVRADEGAMALRYSMHRNISLRVPEGLFLTEIDIAEVQGDSVRLLLHRPLPRAFGVGDHGSWLYQVRFASDQLAVVWETEAVCQFKVGFQVLPESFYELTINGMRVTLDDSFATVSPPERGDIFPISAKNDRIMISGDYVE